MTTEGDRGSWIELAVEVDYEAVEPVVEAFSDVGYNEGVVIEEPFQQEADGDNLRIDPTKPVTVRTYLPNLPSSSDEIERLRSALWHIGQIRPVGDLEVKNRSEEDWANAWKDHYVPIRVGHRVVVRPPWRSYQPEPDDVVVELDPGMAFGTGTHPTTRLCMELLEERIGAGARVLDVGTGSGILAIAAAHLGAASIDAIEVDPVAARHGRENIERNGLADRIALYEGTLDSRFDDERYDLVLANIIARILTELADDLTRVVSNDGTLVLSGIIEGKEAMVTERFEALGFRLDERRQMDDWVAHVWRRSG